MSIQPGQRLAHYLIHEKIGEGGMGTVYRATDARLGRDVAIKVLPDDVSGDLDRMARFQREAQLLAALNHPNIAAIHGLEEAEGQRFLVMELIEGEDLAARLARGPIPVAETLEIARQITEALEEAHERGIVHRDLKPGNVKITPEGKVKVLDFGLAKALEASPAGQTDPSLSPTMTAAATRAGMIMGTAAYMSPEQARGGRVDRRADIWAFGCVVIEMLTGRGAFREHTISDTLASVLKTDPDWDALPAGTPPPLARLLRRCLVKDARGRLRDIGEARVRIEEILAGPGEPEAGPAPPGRAGPGRGLIASAVLGALLLGAALAHLLLRPAPALERGGSPQKFELIRGGFRADPSQAPALSPDGLRVVFVRDDALWIRDLDQIEPRRLAGTERATVPFWSPDGGSVGFARDGGLWKVPVRGGSATTIAGAIGSIGTGGGVTWRDDGRVVYAVGSEGLMEVPGLGGEPRELLGPDPETEGDLHHPQALPGGGLLFVAHRLAGEPDSLYLLAGGGKKRLLQFEGQAILQPVYSQTGHILYRRQGPSAGLWAVPFSLDRLETTGDPFLVDSGGSLASAAGESLLYVRGAESGRQQLVWVGSDGSLQGSVGMVQARILSPAISPGGETVAVMGEESESFSIWIHETGRETAARLTFSRKQDWDPAWTPDGRAVVFWDGVTRALSIKPADGTGDIRRLVKVDYPDSGNPTLTPDGRLMAFWVKTLRAKNDIYFMGLDGEPAPTPIVATPADERYPRLSPDGRYLAYVSDAPGRNEVYLTRFPQGEGKWQISTAGGDLPVWSRRGDRLFYVETGVIMEVELTTDPMVRVGRPRRLFSASEAGVDLSQDMRYDVAADGSRFLMVRTLRDDGAAASLLLVRDWLTEFRGRP